MTASSWRFFTHPITRAAAIIGVAMMTFLFVITFAQAVVMIVSPPSDPNSFRDSLLDEGGQQLRQALAMLGGSVLWSLAPGLLVLSGAILIEWAVRVARAAGVTGRPGLFGFFTHGVARLMMIAVLLYITVWIALNLLAAVMEGRPGFMFFMPLMITFAAPLLILAVLIEYLSRIAQALEKPVRADRQDSAP
ncbi:hypothetical protein F1654_02670 [Alkalicaulis satelles]|uniref:Uncharacterized protein n=1 Tax=Alkalicaulis satelles TaxID=2609175 RepID=A0A5M6ZJF8_9PROT|nr:hypothetical protein [Alkalicaulis satelles]KAA5804919.1 hypothetical protein F1654_02670 [Alkalicaulis satelles]